MKTFSLLSAAALGGITTILLAVVGELAIGISIVIGLVTACGAVFAIPSSIKRELPEQSTSLIPEHHISNDSSRQIAQLNRMISQIAESPVRETVTKIVSLAKQLQAAPSKDPRDEIELRSFFNHYLPSAVEICSRCLELSQQPYHTPDLKAALEKAEQMLVQIQFAFDKQLSNLLKNDILDLNVEVSVLEQSLRIDGLLQEQSNTKDHL